MASFLCATDWHRQGANNRAGKTRYGRGVVAFKQKRYARSVSALKILSSNLRRLRKERGWTQEQLAERAGLTYRHFQQIEGVDRPGLQVATVERLAKALNVEMADLFCLVPDRSRK